MSFNKEWGKGVGRDGLNHPADRKEALMSQRDSKPDGATFPHG